LLRFTEQTLAVELVAQFPPEPLRIFRPDENPKAALRGAAAGTPLVIHRAEPSQLFQKLLAKSRFQPGEVFVLGGPFAGDQPPPPPRRANRLPLLVTLAKLDAAPHEIAALRSYGQMAAPVQRRRFAIWTMLRFEHSRSAVRSPYSSLPRRFKNANQGIAETDAAPTVRQGLGARSRFGIGMPLWLASRDLKNAAAHSLPFFKKSSYAKRIPLARSTCGRHPKASRRELSMSLRGVPSGLVSSQMISPAKPTARFTISVSPRIETSLPAPMLMNCSSL